MLWVWLVCSALHQLSVHILAPQVELSTPESTRPTQGNKISPSWQQIPRGKFTKEQTEIQEELWPFFRGRPQSLCPPVTPHAYQHSLLVLTSNRNTWLPCTRFCTHNEARDGGVEDMQRSLHQLTGVHEADMAQQIRSTDKMQNISLHTAQIRVSAALPLDSRQ